MRIRMIAAHTAWRRCRLPPIAVRDRRGRLRGDWREHIRLNRRRQSPNQNFPRNSSARMRERFRGCRHEYRLNLLKRSKTFRAPIAPDSRVFETTKGKRDVVDPIVVRHIAGADSAANSV